VLTVTEQGRRISLVSLLVAGSWAIPHVASACSCLPPEPPKQALDSAEAVFVGRLIAADDASADDTVRRIYYQFQVSRAWKGELGATVTLSSAASSAACGRGFALDDEYLIYASADQSGELTDSLCSRTRTLVSADEDLALLGPGRPPAPNTAAPSTAPSAQEPPRIEPPAKDHEATPPVTEAAAKGCAIAGTSPPLSLASLLILGIAGVVRRRERAASTRCALADPGGHGVGACERVEPPHAGASS